MACHAILPSQRVTSQKSVQEAKACTYELIQDSLQTFTIFGTNRPLLLHSVTYLAKSRGALGHAVVGPVGLHATV